MRYWAHEILGNVCIVIINQVVMSDEIVNYDVIIFEINFAFLINLFSLHDQNSRQKFKYLRTKRSFKTE